ncbi:MAG: Gfo/Idh/MocA family oxidoreductase [Chloroflexi bacterium]|nr:Gfo/Idh/MocA family oxidoreductase [Chloroflexota bacterium]
MSKKINWGILSTAHINNALFPGFKKSRRNHLLAVASRSLPKAQDYARQNNIERAYGSYQELIDDPNIQAVYIPLPNHMHAEWAVKAAAAGKHVLCEKPIALTLAEMDAIQQAAADHKVIIQEAFMYRHHPQTLRVAQLFQQGLLGDIHLIRGTFSFYLRRSDDIRLVAEYGGGSIWDVGCYPISYARHLIGRLPASVFGMQETAPSGVDLSFNGIMHFQPGLHAQFDSSFAMHSYRQLEIRGTEGTIVIPEPFSIIGKSTIHILSNGSQYKETFPAVDKYHLQLENMADAILDGQPQRVTLQDSRENTALILAFLESARLQRPVEL